jgi:hypothetical protein
MPPDRDVEFVIDLLRAHIECLVLNL